MLLPVVLEIRARSSFPLGGRFTSGRRYAGDQSGIDARIALRVCHFRLTPLLALFPSRGATRWRLRRKSVCGCPP